MDHELSTTTTIELAGELLKGGFDAEQINKILLEASSNYESSANYLAYVIAERTGE